MNKQKMDKTNAFAEFTEMNVVRKETDGLDYASPLV